MDFRLVNSCASPHTVVFEPLLQFWMQRVLEDGQNLYAAKPIRSYPLQKDGNPLSSGLAASQSVILHLGFNCS